VKPLLFVRNDPVETFGIAPKVFADEGIPVRVLDALEPASAWPAVGEVCGIVMFGGSMNVDEVDHYPFLVRDRELALQAVTHATPYLGICLGAQLLARALDRPVFPAPEREIGFEPVRPLRAAAADPLLSHYADGDLVFHWHEDTLELPEAAVALAEGDHIPVQAFRVGGAAWGLQFHFEIDGPEMELWLEDFASGLEEKWGKSPERVREEAREHLADHEAKGSQVLRRFAEVVRTGRG
jgi:GMP synthase (glutamine-hydrolysing)